MNPRPSGTRTPSTSKNVPLTKAIIVPRGAKSCFVDRDRERWHPRRGYLREHAAVPDMRVIRVEEPALHRARSHGVTQATTTSEPGSRTGMGAGAPPTATTMSPLRRRSPSPASRSKRSSPRAVVPAAESPVEPRTCHSHCRLPLACVASAFRRKDAAAASMSSPTAPSGQPPLKLHGRRRPTKAEPGT